MKKLALLLLITSACPGGETKCPDGWGEIRADVFETCSRHGGIDCYAHAEAVADMRKGECE